MSESDPWGRRRLSRDEFDARCARLEEYLLARGLGVSQTSGRRTESRNALVGGSPTSAHLEGLARDYVTADEPSGAELQTLYTAAQVLGLWAIYHRNHLHVQGRAPA